MHLPVAIDVNGRSYTREVEPRLLLVHFLRDVAGLTGTKIGCDTSQCGSCTVLLDGVAVKSCTLSGGAGRRLPRHDHRRAGARRPAAPAAGGVLGEARPAVRLLHAGHGLRRARDPANQPNPSPEQIRHGLEGNLCRCTGYQNIVRAVQAAAGRDAREADDDVHGADRARLRFRASGGAKIRGCSTGTARTPPTSRCRAWSMPPSLRSPHGHARIRGIDTSRARPAARRGRASSPAPTRPGVCSRIPCAWLLPNAGLKIAPLPCVRDRHRPLRGRRGRRRRRRDRVPGVRRARADRRRLRAAAGGRRSDKATKPGAAAAARRRAGQCRVSLDGRGRRRRRGIRVGRRRRARNGSSSSA